MKNQTDGDLLNRKQLAELLQVSPQTIYNWDRAGRFPRIELSTKCVRYSRAEVLEMIRNRKAAK